MIASGALLVDGQGGSGTEIGASAFGTQSGNAGAVTVGAGSVSTLNGGYISSSTTGTGMAGSVRVTTPGTLLLDGRGAASPIFTGIAAQA